MSQERAAAREVVGRFGREFEVDHDCTCAAQPAMAPITLTGHKNGCEVDNAVRLYLAECGIV